MKTKGAVLYEVGLPQPYVESMPLVIADLDLTGPGHGEVLVEVAAAGICHSDLSVVNGSRPRGLPLVMGHEASGVVRDIGPNVTGLQTGDHVVFSFVPVCGQCIYCESGRGALCEPGAKSNVAGTLLSGSRHFRDSQNLICNHHLGVSGFAQFTVAAEQSLVKVDEALPFEIAALFGCAVMTGVGAVFNTAQLPKGSSVAVFGLGGVGLTIIMGAKAAGAGPIIAIDRVDDKLTLASEVGATHTINSHADDPVEALRQLTQGGADYVFESVGSEEVLIQAYQATRRGGTTVTVGLPDPGKMFSISAVSLVMEERTLKGSYMGSCVPRRDIPRFIEMYMMGVLPVNKLHTHSLRLEEINLGFDRLANVQAVRQVISFSNS